MTDLDESTKKELIKAGVDLTQLVYGDAIQPLAIETGKALGTVGKTVNVALAPLRGLVWSWDQIEFFVTRKIAEKLEQRNVPPERIRPPNPDIAVPAIEALRYSKLRDNYAALLATSMDTATADQAHPAFVEILKQMTKDEALILEYLPQVGRHEPLVDLGYVDRETGAYLLVRHLGTLGADANCSASAHIPALVDNLCRLGLTECPSDIGLFEDWRYDRIRALPTIEAEQAKVPQSCQFFEQKKMIGLTELGSAFRKACVS